MNVSMNAISLPRLRALAIAMVALLVGILAEVAPLVAQETLRYVTNDEGTVYLESPQGPVDVIAEQYSDVTFVISGTRLTATFDSLYSYLGGTNGDQSPDVTALLEGAFELEFERPGVVVTHSYPEVDVGTAQALDPLHLFDDFFVPLPEEGLEVGREWSETLVHEGSSQGDATYYSERIMTMKVERDTVVNGASGYVVSVSQDVTIESTGYVPGQGFPFTSYSGGTDIGIAIIDAEGVMLSRSRTTDMTGLFSIDVQGQAFDMPQTINFTGTVELVSGG